MTSLAAKGRKKRYAKLQNYYGKAGHVPPFAQMVLAELIDPQRRTLNIKLVAKRTGAFARLKAKEADEWALAEKIEAEIARTGCPQEAAIEKIAPRSREPTYRVLRIVRERREKIEKFLAPFARFYNSKK
jgi:hypothetical protein